MRGKFGGGPFSHFFRFFKKYVDGAGYIGDNYNRIVGNKSVANVVVGISNR